MDKSLLCHSFLRDSFKKSIKISTYRRLEIRDILKNHSLDEIEKYIQEIKNSANASVGDGSVL